MGSVIIDEFGKIKDADKEYLRQVGSRNLGEVMGRNMSEWATDSDRTKIAKGLCLCCEKGFIRDFELEISNKYGMKIPIEIHAILIETKENRLIVALSKDITNRKQLHDKLKQRSFELAETYKQLEIKTSSLEKTDIALTVLLEKREKDKIEIENLILCNVKQMVVPYLEKIKRSQLDGRQKILVNLLESGLDKLISPFLHNLASAYSNLTRKEIQVAMLVKEGKSTKEIAELLILSMNTIEFHRKNIRKKLGINNIKAINLQSHLLSLILQ